MGLAGYLGRAVFVPAWVVISCALALGLSTITGGYNMIKTVGMDICKIDTQNSFASQLSTISVVMTANVTGLPISVPQIITGSVMGVGTEKDAQGSKLGSFKENHRCVDHHHSDLGCYRGRRILLLRLL